MGHLRRELVSEEDDLPSVGHSGMGLACSGPLLPWFAVRVRGRYEMTASTYLRSMGHEEFLPLYTTRKKWSDRIKEARVPLFPGYLFCRFDPERHLAVLRAPGVLDIVGTSRQLIAVEESEINAIRRLVASGIPSEPWPFLEVGERVEIESGPLRGLEGVLLESKANRRLILSVSLLRRSVAVEIDSALVRPRRTSFLPTPSQLYTGVHRVLNTDLCPTT